MESMRYLVLFFAVFAISCSSESDMNGVKVIDLEDAFDNNSEYVYLSKYASSIDYIPLETCSEALFGECPKYIINKDSLYVKYIPNYHFIVVFNANTGKYLDKLDRRGRGPGEYLGCDPFDVDDSTNDIIVWSIN